MRLLLFLLIATPGILHAQYDDLLRKKRYTWVAEYTADYELNPLYSETVETEMNLTQVIRLENHFGVNGLHKGLELSHYLSTKLLQGLSEGAFACFSDAQSTQKISSIEMKKLLTRPRIHYFHERADTILFEVQPHEIDLFRIRQVLYFDARMKKFGARLLSVAPLVNILDKNKNVINRRPLLWIKTPHKRNCLGKKLPKSASYIVQTFMRENAPTWDELTITKGSLDLKKWTESEVRKPSHTCLSFDDFLRIEKGTLQAKLFSRDTLAVLDPETLEENGKIVVENNAIDRVEKIRFIQNWYYNERKHHFTMQVVAVAPMAAVRDSEGNLWYYKPLFYSKY